MEDDALDPSEASPSSRSSRPLFLGEKVDLPNSFLNPLGTLDEAFEALTSDTSPISTSPLTFSTSSPSSGSPLFSCGPGVAGWLASGDETAGLWRDKEGELTLRTCINLFPPAGEDNGDEPDRKDGAFGLSSNPPCAWPWPPDVLVLGCGLDTRDPLLSTSTRI